MSVRAEALPTPLTEGAPSLLRLSRVEGRKMFDTRAGLWLSIATVVLSLGIAIVALALTDSPQMVDFLRVAGAVVSVFLPILGILLVTSEWSQRTGLLTFALVPRRGRVLSAKAVAGVAIGTAISLACLAGAFVAAVAGGLPIRLPAADLPQAVILQFLTVLSGIALGLAVMRSAPAIVAYFLIPSLLGALGAVSSGVADVTSWLDGSATTYLSEGPLSVHQWAMVAVYAGVWIAVPMAIGLWRLGRTELK